MLPSGELNIRGPQKENLPSYDKKTVQFIIFFYIKSFLKSMHLSHFSFQQLIPNHKTIFHADLERSRLRYPGIFDQKTGSFLINYFTQDFQCFHRLQRLYHSPYCHIKIINLFCKSVIPIQLNVRLKTSDIPVAIVFSRQSM